MGPAATATKAATIPGASESTPDQGAQLRWAAGDEITLRYITRAGAPGMSWPCNVVEDRNDFLALYIPRGAQYMRWDASSGVRRLTPARWRRDVLRLMFPGACYSTWLFWDDHPARSFSAYYVNFEEPFRRTAIGVDTNDHTLDIVVAPDLTWRWKDEDDFEERVRGGVYSQPFAHELQAEAKRVVERIEGGAPPFDGAWARWAPDPEWSVPRLHSDWDREPATLWERRHWAYLDTR